MSWLPPTCCENQPKLIPNKEDINCNARKGQNIKTIYQWSIKEIATYMCHL